MVTVEYGRQHQKVILLLHGGGLNCWNYCEIAEKLQERYHVVIPILDGHAGSDRPFTTIENNAAALIAYIDEHFGGSVALIGGLSLGAQILTEMLVQRIDICRFALIESALVIPMKGTQRLIRLAVKESYGLIRRRWFAKLQFRSLKMKKEWFEDYYRDTCGIGQKDMIAFMQANAGYAVKEGIARTQAEVFLFVGQKEPKIMRRSARKLQQLIPGSRLTVMPQRYHGEFSLNHPLEYAQTVSRLLADA